MKKSFILTFLILILSSCVTNQKDDVDFFINKGNTIQYFFPERGWSSSNNNVKFVADWLYRDYALEEHSGEPRTLINFSILSDSNLFRKIPNKIVLSNGFESLEIPKEQVSLVFIDKGRTRYSAWMNSKDIADLMVSTQQQLDIKIDFDQEYIFNSNKTFIPHIQYFKEVILGVALE